MSARKGKLNFCATRPHPSILAPMRVEPQMLNGGKQRVPVEVR